MRNFEFDIRWYRWRGGLKVKVEEHTPQGWQFQFWLAAHPVIYLFSHVAIRFSPLGTCQSAASRT
jgi:hypothetical protein